MSRRLAHRPRHYQAQVSHPRPLSRSRQDYLRQRWTYRQQHASSVPRPLGYSLALIPWGWQRVYDTVRLQA